MKPKNIQLIRTLSEQLQPINSNTLASNLGISVRSVKNYIKEINDSYPDTILSSRDGYQIDKEKAMQILQGIDSHIPQSSKERVVYILSRIIKSDKPVDAYDLCDEMYISMSTMKNELQKVKRRMQHFDLELVNSNECLTIIGLEKNKRKMLSTILYNESNVNFVNLKAIQNAFMDIDIEFIKNTVLKVFEEYHYYVNDYSLINLVLHIAIAIDRIRNNNVNTTDVRQFSAVRLHEYELAQKVVHELENRFCINYTDAEIYELALLLISRATTIDYKSINSSNIEEFIGKDCLDLVNELILSVSSYYYIDLTEQEFFIRFALHIRNLLVRSKNNYFSKNPLTEGIKTSCPLIYDVSVVLANIIRERTGIAINDDEIAYIAFHLGSTLEAQKDLNTKITAVLYCPNYYNINRRLVDTINQHFASDMLITNILTDESEFEKIAETDLILSTIPLSIIITKPVIQVSIFLNEKDIHLIRMKVDDIKIAKKQTLFNNNLRSLIQPDLFEKRNDLKDKDQVIAYMISKLTEKDYVDETFIDEINERERMSSTAFNAFAIPHAMKMNAKKTGICLLLSDEPILWNKNSVQLVMMLCFNKNERFLFNEIYEPITMILSETENVRKVIQCNDYDEFISMMVSLLKV